ncbi:Lipoprotein [Sulfitobacter noctilucicola]|uniref:DUF2927 domain-containing protein n=1 Tax=Sulfitobacter noctilucicola TaxID=1342301 RepID=A0A7W6Q4S9_9RHOB|nr:DUF2927 domain-containing protein [Sulfitobacter noctilucicola]KIN64299.1 Lipoprotein [Sulfitobacter noctilucicola]MBB4174534.1 hypothetical protein [Sulfitobacter noctilucicola]
MTGRKQIRSFKAVAAALGALVLVGCAAPAPVTPSLKPQARPAVVKPPAPPVVAKPTSQKSAMLRQYLHQVESAQLSQGLLRKDGGGADTPFTADMLARNFEQIAFFNEYDSALSGRGGASPLRRWAEPVRMEVIFGAGVPPSQRKSDTDTVNRYSRRLARATGHPISAIGAPNFLVIIASEDDRADALADAAGRVPGISLSSLNALRNLRRDTYCAVAAYAAGPDASTYTAAVAVIRAENPDLLRLSCIHEELAQGLGLANDSPAARPSIFNDDDEFALLTTHDELLLKMLYDKRLRAGMHAIEAAPITRIIAREMIAGPL